ncbi:MAG: alpha/beta hydrolase [Paucibacter sp.]|nr:alpha/beta hydrolase [Roseateles sp.]
MSSSPLVVDGVPIWIEGSGPETILMIHGWPDTCRLWDHQVEALSADYRCARFTLPGFEAGAKRRAHTLDELCGFFERVVDAVSPGAPVTLLLHDWGCFFGYQFYSRFPQRVKRIVGVDVGDTGTLRAEASTRVLLLIAAYQNWLALAWRIGGRLGDWMALWMVSLVRCPTQEPHRGAQQGYAYYMTWWARKNSYRREGRRFRPECPMLFIYGKRKPFMFHAESWLERLRARTGNRVEAFETGHWVMIEQPEEFNRVVREWLA